MGLFAMLLKLHLQNKIAIIFFKTIQFFQVTHNWLSNQDANVDMAPAARHY